MDKDKIHIDIEFTDYSWQEMSKLLDQEMPVKKRKKRFIWIWFIGIGLLGLIGLTYLQQTNQSNLRALPVPTILQKVATNSSDKKITHQSTASDKAIKKVSNQLITTKSSDKISVISTIKKPTKKSPTAANTPTAVGVGASLLPKNDFTTTTVPTKLGDVPLSEISPNLPIQKTELFKFVPIARLTPSLLTIPNKGETIPIFPVKNKLKWRLGIYAGTLAPNFGSFRTGLYANMLFTPKWTLHFGLGYAKRISSTILTINNPQEVTSPVHDMQEDMNDDASSDPTPPKPTSNANELTNNQPIHFSDFHYFELPLLVNYKISSNLSIELGGSLSYLHGYQYQYNQTAVFTKDSNLAAAFNTTRATNLINNTPTISTINWALIGGANYQLTNKLTAYANYHYSSPYLKGTIDAMPTKKRWQQMELGIRYYFK